MALELSEIIVSVVFAVLLLLAFAAAETSNTSRYVWITALICLVILIVICGANPDNPDVFDHIIMGTVLMSVLLVAAAVIIVPLCMIIFAPVINKMESEAEYSRYSSAYKDLCGKIDIILRNGGRLEPIGDPETAVVYMPDGKVSLVKFEGKAEDWFLNGLPEGGIDNHAKAEDILAAPDIMIIKSGKYKEKAAGRILQNAREKCAAIKDSLNGGDFWIKDRSVVYVTREGKAGRTEFELPVHILFRPPANDIDLAKYLVSESMLISAVTKSKT